MWGSSFLRLPTPKGVVGHEGWNGRRRPCCDNSSDDKIGGELFFFCGGWWLLVVFSRGCTEGEEIEAGIELASNKERYVRLRTHEEGRLLWRAGVEISFTQFRSLCCSLLAGYAERVESTDEFPGAFKRAVETQRPALLEICVDRGQITPDRRVSLDG